MLEKFLIPNFNKDSNLFAFNSPLGTFSGKINIAYSLGLIDKDIATAIHFTRELRNDCAHKIFVKIENGTCQTSKLLKG